jgi:hypothetical protein
MIPLAVPNLAGNEARYLQDCVATNFVSSVGPFVRRFEEMVAAATGAADAVAVSSGTVGLHLALVTAGVGRDDLVILPALTFIASANAIAHCGATPWLLDVSAESWTLDPAALDRTLAAETERRGGRLLHRASGRRVAAVMPVHTLGHPADMDAIAAIAAHHRLAVIADGAAALGATYKGRRPAELGAALTVLSFNGNKTVTAGGGGAVIGTDAGLLGIARHLSTTARVGEAYEHDRVGYNYRMTSLQAAVGCAQMEQLRRRPGGHSGGRPVSRGALGGKRVLVRRAHPRSSGRSRRAARAAARGRHRRAAVLEADAPAGPLSRRAPHRPAGDRIDMAAHRDTALLHAPVGGGAGSRDRGDARRPDAIGPAWRRKRNAGTGRSWRRSPERARITACCSPCSP